MRVPKQLRDVDRHGATVRTYDYDDSAVIAVDFGVGAGDITVDVVDGTAIVVTGDEQFEFELPADASDVSVKNGILTITE
ncbi:hypothetical protein HALLA_19365 [Halostagnicola larsenii XH-48]|uniref:Hsp20/alpha crystallin family protein n=1 Tax=Halostagnicola larsenii XH-48 TaxID=797299 RepID=W0JPH4_9EURY|nr:hypothetical protein [Halostagnicola larsenii]AHG00626.1 hypothetical protein HALLA_19365 [Halostagnicola larsenii XH-48]